VCAYCLQRRNLRRTLRIAFVVGLVLTVINQGDVIISGHATTATWVRCALNFVPFLGVQRRAAQRPALMAPRPDVTGARPETLRCDDQDRSAGRRTVCPRSPV